jgi:hypothetical protein
MLTNLHILHIDCPPTYKWQQPKAIESDKITYIKRKEPKTFTDLRTPHEDSLFRARAQAVRRFFYKKSTDVSKIFTWTPERKIVYWEAEASLRQFVEQILLGLEAHILRQHRNYAYFVAGKRKKSFSVMVSGEMVKEFLATPVADPIQPPEPKTLPKEASPTVPPSK